MTIDPDLSATQQIAELLTERARHIDRIALLIEESAKNERRAISAEGEARGLREELDMELRVSGERADELEKLKMITASMDGFRETAELFKIGAVLGVSDDMGRGPDGEGDGPEHGEILSALKKLREQNDTFGDLLRAARNRLTRVGGHDSLCAQIRHALYPTTQD